MKAFIVFLALLAVASTAHAGDGTPSAEEIVRRLTPVMALTRSLPAPRGISVEAATTPVERPSVDLEVNFAFNSAALTTDAMLTLDQLGLALTDPALADGHFEIAGHTDAKGSDRYNQKLSETRAAAVTAYLVNKYRVDAKHLASVGYGKTRLSDPEHPEAAVNRRVQVTRLDQ